MRTDQSTIQLYLFKYRHNRILQSYRTKTTCLKSGFKNKNRKKSEVDLGDELERFELLESVMQETGEKEIVKDVTSRNRGNWTKWREKPRQECDVIK